MSFSYKHESKIFFWIVSILFSTFIFSILYYFNIFNDTYVCIIPCYFSIALLVGLFFLGFFSRKTTLFVYSFIKKKDPYYKITKDLSEDTKKMIKRYKEVVYNIDLGEKDRSIEIIQRTVGFNREYAKKVFYIVKNIKKTKSILILSGFFLAIILYFSITYIDFLIFIKETTFFTISIVLIVFLLFYFKSLLFSDLPIDFYLNLIKVNKIRLEENKEDIKECEKELSDYFDQTYKKNKLLKEKVYFLTQRGIKKKDIIDILNSKGISSFGLKDIIMQSKESNLKENIKTNELEVSKNLEDIINLYAQTRTIDKKILELKEKLDNLKNVQETIEKINTDKWDYYKNIKFNSFFRNEHLDKDLSEEISNKINFKKELTKNYQDTVKDLYNSFYPFVSSLTKDKISSILISKGYSYETINDLFEKFKENKIDLDKNKMSFQEKMVSKINSFYESFKD
jgi:SOS response regulatory protein OraA/RecX